jgi:hypothetical protein
MKSNFLAALFLLLTAIAQGARAGSSVEVVNDAAHPVPVVATIANSPSVTVANTPAVTISNTPTVNVATLPALQFPQNASVQVANAPAAPVPTRDVDADARNAFQALVQLDYPSVAEPQATNYIATVPLPSGQRLVIDYVTITGGAAGVGGNIQPVVRLRSTLPSGQVVSTLTPAFSSAVPTNHSYSAPTRIYADALEVSLSYGSYPSGTAPQFLNAQVAIAGHLVSP